MQGSFVRFALIGLAMALTACNSVNFDSAPKPPPSDDGKGTNLQLGLQGNGEVEAYIGAGRTTEVLKTLQPTLAVRGMTCLLCHADIRANVVTDFGYGNTWYMGGNEGASAGSYYNNFVAAWQTAKNISGTVYVPDALVPQKAMAMLGDGNAPAIKLKDFMNTPYKMVDNWDSRTTETAPMTEKVLPPNGGEKVVAKSKIVIRAPSAAEIQALAPELVNAAGWKKIAGKGTPDLQIANFGNGDFVMNNTSGTLNCENTDIVVKGTLYLKSLSVNAVKGCRIYVTGSVFIEDEITYVGPADKQNLQITSARTISMGINYDNLKARLEHGFSQSLQSLDPVALRAQILADANLVRSSTTLKDAAESNPRKSINFEGLLLNAPLVHSRYLGNVKGTIIAEIAIFAIGAFHFEFDKVFTEVTVLPKLSQDVLLIQ